MRYFVASVPERSHVVEELKIQIPELEVVKDKNRIYMETHLRIMRLAEGCKAIYLEDDITLTSDFKEKIQPVIDSRPNDVIQFFSRRKKDPVEGSRYDGYFSFCCCFYMPEWFVAEYLAFAPAWLSSHPNCSKSGTDYMIDDFLKWKKRQHWIHVPSLVQHNDMTSTIRPGRSTKRQSDSFLP